MSDEEAPLLSQIDIEPTPLHLQSNIPPHAGVANCIIIRPRSLTSSLRTPTSERSRTNSVNANETEEIINSSTNDLTIL